MLRHACMHYPVACSHLREEQRVVLSVGKHGVDGDTQLVPPSCRDAEQGHRIAVRQDLRRLQV